MGNGTPSEQGTDGASNGAKKRHNGWKMKGGEKKGKRKGEISLSLTQDAECAQPSRGGKGRERGEKKGEKELLPHLLVPTGLRNIGREMDVRKR